MYNFILALLMVLLAACSDSGVVTSSEYEGDTTNNTTGATVVPGTTFSVVDFYISGSGAYLVVKNNTSKDLPSFYMDYTLQCDSAQEVYGNEYFSLESYEQYSSILTVLSGKYSSCSLTITTIRDGAIIANRYFTSWTGTYTVTTDMY